VSDTAPFVFEPTGEAKRHAPATERNRDAISAVLESLLPTQGIMLEVASGTGEHIIHFARCFPHLTWQPSDAEPAALRSIAAWCGEAGLSNVRRPLEIDASGDWPVDHADSIICINMVHISPWAATLGLLCNASRILPPGGMLYLYGPYRQRDVPTAPSNEEFDRSLKERNPDWGLRYVEDVATEASTAGLSLDHVIEMPANNLSLLFRSSNSAIQSPD
jgi:SAM-dependent methyltransferase